MSTTRRGFIRQSSLLTAGLFLHKEDWFKPSRAIGVQLYTLRDAMEKDPKDTLAKVARLGYTQVEMFNYGEGKWFGMTPAELKVVLQDNGLSSPSGHTFPAGYFLRKGWEESWKKTVADAKTLGQEFIVSPWLEEEYRGGADKFRQAAEALNAAGEIARQQGLTLAYHNHDFEFAPLGDTTGYAVLLANTDPRLVGFELDIYWAEKAGFDPVALFKKYPGRFPLWHVKDMDNSPKKFFTEVGNGVIDFKGIFREAKLSGMRYFFVEQDECPGSPFDSIEKSIGYLKKHIVRK
ncbi:MAG: sugar phosphate isomerase/epimerase [Candidatus Pseudobacter hemicellulosilyticus]|uniref:Sugar phosphate isomerase/epimerase n=1 Tax=Candidatus Pseudobacter hemicellulosilyticus TaxID=3121375 RepID=A0AAJ5WTK9_9BACT|nr:MAG: sugar phosphate isomerase/epimerase [Pseudobacter sp.]